MLSELALAWKSRALWWVLTRREVAARTAGSAGGLLWLWLPPLATIAAYFVVFDLIFSMRLSGEAGVSRVGAFLAVGMLAWQQFADAVQRGMSSLLDAGGTLQKNPLPPILFPLRAVGASTLVFVPLLVLLTLLYAPQHGFGVGVLAVPLLLAAQTLISFLLAYLLAIFAAAIRDTVQVVGVMLSLGVFLSSILFPLSLFPAEWRWLLWLNPMTAPVLGYQAALLRGEWPGWEVWAVMAVWAAVLWAALGVVVARSREQLVDWL